jgi:hypothetical protein
VGYPSGQREQTVNLPASRLRRFESFPHHSEGVFGDRLLGGRRDEVPAGVAQLVERKPSKLDVAGSSPVSRFGALSRPEEKVEGLKVESRRTTIDAGVMRVLVAGIDEEIAQVLA